MSKLSETLAAEAGITMAAAKELVDRVRDLVLRLTADGEPVKITGLGTFSRRPTPDRMARNPKTGDPVFVPGRVKLIFKEERRRG